MANIAEAEPMVTKRQINQLQKESEVVEELTGDWLSATEIAIRLKKHKKGDVYSIACALRRLVDRGEVIKSIRRVPANGRPYDNQAIYCVPGLSKAVFPTWLEPRVPAFRIAKRQIFKVK